MSDVRKTKFKEPMEDIDLPKMKLEVESEAKPETPLTAEQIYVKRKAEVAQQDNEDFSDYLREKAAREACFDRRTSRVIAALKYDWVPNVRNLAEAWQKGGVLKISKIYPDPKTGKYDYLGTKGQKIECSLAFVVMPLIT